MNDPAKDPANARVLIIGSGPAGATYARLLVESGGVDVVMVDAGPRLTDPVGMNVRNIADPAAQAAAKQASQGPASGEAGIRGIPTGTAVEGTITARQGTHLIGRAADGSTGMPAAAGSTNVGGQGAHWTCATPRPRGSERIAFLEPELDELLDVAERLLHTTHTAFAGAPQAAALLDLVQAEFAEDKLTVQPLPVAGDPQPDGSMRWGGTDVVLGPLLDSADGRFELHPGTLAVRLLLEGTRVVGAVLRDVATGEETSVLADAVVVAADALRTPQLLWASGIRPDALGRHLTEHPLIFGVVAVREGLLPPLDPGQGPIDPVRAVVGIRFDEEHDHPFHAQLLFSPVCPVPLPPGSPHADHPAGFVGMGWGVRKRPRPEDRLLFDDTEPDASGLPGIRIAYEVTDWERAEIERARAVQARAAAVIGTFLDGMPREMPPGSSLHYMGTVRMGEVDDGTSVCDPDSRPWGIDGLVLGGNGLIPTANACNPTLTTVALAVRGARALIARLGADR